MLPVPASNREQVNANREHNTLDGCCPLRTRRGRAIAAYPEGGAIAAYPEVVAVYPVNKCVLPAVTVTSSPAAGMGCHFMTSDIVRSDEAQKFRRASQQRKSDHKIKIFSFSFEKDFPLK